MTNPHQAMRELKFRAWDKGLNKMCSPWPDAEDFDMVGLNGGDRYIPMQFTGLKDKNGKEIYEGDIMGAGIVKWLDGDARFKLVGVDWEHPMRYASQNYEVIGNIYENPDLLTPEK